MQYEATLGGCIVQTMLQQVFDKQNGCYFYAVQTPWQHDYLMQDRSTYIATDADRFMQGLSDHCLAIYVPESASLSIEAAKSLIAKSTVCKAVFWHHA